MICEYGIWVNLWTKTKFDVQKITIYKYSSVHQNSPVSGLTNYHIFTTYGHGHGYDHTIQLIYEQLFTSSTATTVGEPMTGRFSFHSKPHAGNAPELPDIAIWVRNDSLLRSMLFQVSHTLFISSRFDTNCVTIYYWRNRFDSYWVHFMGYFWEYAMKHEGSLLRYLASISSPLVRRNRA